MNRITNSAAMLVRESGSTVSLKKRKGPAPSILEASTSSFGMVRKNWRKNRVAVAEAMRGIVSPAKESSIPRSATTL